MFFLILAPAAGYRVVQSTQNAGLADACGRVNTALNTEGNSWVEGEWGVCAFHHGQCTQTREVTCESDGATVSDHLCGPDRPPQTSDCVCTVPSWVGEWGACADDSGTCQRTRQVTCSLDGDAVSDEFCGALPPLTQQCDSAECFSTCQIDETNFPMLTFSDLRPDPTIQMSCQHTPPMLSAHSTATFSCSQGAVVAHELCSCWKKGQLNKQHTVPLENWNRFMAEVHGSTQTWDIEDLRLAGTSKRQCWKLCLQHNQWAQSRNEPGCTVTISKMENKHWDDSKNVCWLRAYDKPFGKFNDHFKPSVRFSYDMRCLLKKLSDPSGSFAEFPLQDLFDQF